MSALDEAERLAWSVLQTVNRTQAKGSMVRIIVPSDPEVADKLGRELARARRSWWRGLFGR